jgi:tight adherence protein C
MSQMIVPILAFVAVVSIGGAMLLVRWFRRRGIEQRLYGHSTSSSTTWSSAGGTRSERVTDALEQVGRAVSSDGGHGKDLTERLNYAGFYQPAAATIYVGAQLVLLVIGLALGGLLALTLRQSLMIGLCIALATMAIFALLPNFYVSTCQRRRSNEVRRKLPDAIDLLEICVSSGMGLDQSWNAVADEFRSVSTTLADEMALATLEIQLGSPRAEALRNMATRTSVQDISSLVSTLVQSERFGTSVSQALRAYADALRTERSQRAEEQAEKLAVKLLFPMVTLIFPVMFLVILGPAGIRIYEMFAKG